MANRGFLPHAALFDVQSVRHAIITRISLRGFTPPRDRQFAIRFRITSDEDSPCLDTVTAQVLLRRKELVAHIAVRLCTESLFNSRRDGSMQTCAHLFGVRDSETRGQSRLCVR